MLKHSSLLIVDLLVIINHTNSSKIFCDFEMFDIINEIHIFFFQAIDILDECGDMFMLKYSRKKPINVK